MAIPKSSEEKNRRMKLGIAALALITLAYAADKIFGPTGDWKTYAYVVGLIFGFIGGYLTLTDIFGKK